MLFNSIGFVVFLATVLLVDRLPLSWPARKLNLLLASLLFYAAWFPPAVLLLLATLGIDYGVARAIHSEPRPRRRKLYLIASLLANFGVLCFCKYSGFLWRNLTTLADALHLQLPGWEGSVLLPLGISFYTFQSVSYVLDVYRGRVPAARSLPDFGLYVSFFPHLVAGPIVRYADFAPQLEQPRRATLEQFSRGMLLFIFGLFLKVTLSDAVFAPVVESVYGAPTVGLHSLYAWAGIAGFAGQLYCDFAGYSMCAVGLALCFGFHFPWNFRTPYGATSFGEFWTRWHISLSTWIRDYIYLPLGGNRLGPRRTAFNLMAAFVFSGFWHGASWNFGIWGALHGLLLITERSIEGSPLGKLTARVPALCKAAAVTSIYALTLVFFRAADLPQAGAMLARAFTFTGSAEPGAPLWPWQWQLCFVAMALLFLFHFAFRTLRPIEYFESRTLAVRSSITATLLVVMFTSLPEKGHVFIYFQF